MVCESQTFEVEVINIALEIVILRRGEIFKIMNSISFQVKFHVFIYRYYGTMVKNSIFRCLGLRKRLERSRKPLYNSKIFFSCV